MQPAKFLAFNKTVRRFKIRFRFRGESGDHVREDGNARHARAQRGHFGGILLRAIVAVHCFEHAVTAALQWQMQVIAKAVRTGGHGVYNAVRHGLQFYGRKTNTEAALQRGDIRTQGGQILAALRAGIVADINARQYNFAKSFLRQRGDFFQHVRHGLGAFDGARERHNAIRTKAVAPVLYFNKRAAVPFVAGHRPANIFLSEKFLPQIIFADYFRLWERLPDMLRMRRGITAGQYQPCGRIAAGNLTNEFFHVLIGLVGNGAGIEQTQVRLFKRSGIFPAAGRELLQNGLAFHLIDAAAECF